MVFPHLPPSRGEEHAEQREAEIKTDQERARTRVRGMTTGDKVVLLVIVLVVLLAVLIVVPSVT